MKEAKLVPSARKT